MAWHDALGALNNFKKSLEVKPSETVVKQFKAKVAQWRQHRICNPAP